MKEIGIVSDEPLLLTILDSLKPETLYLTIEITALKGNICRSKTEYFLSFSDNCCHNQKQSA